MPKYSDAQRMEVYRKRVEEVRGKMARLAEPRLAKLSKALRILERLDLEGDAGIWVTNLIETEREWIEDLVSYEDALNLKDHEQVGQKRVDALPPIERELPEPI